jgi:hypothetical protein
MSPDDGVETQPPRKARGGAGRLLGGVLVAVGMVACSTSLHTLRTVRETSQSSGSPPPGTATRMQPPRWSARRRLPYRRELLHRALRGLHARARGQRRRSLLRPVHDVLPGQRGPGWSSDGERRGRRLHRKDRLVALRARKVYRHGRRRAWRGRRRADSRAGR